MKPSARILKSMIALFVASSLFFAACDKKVEYEDEPTVTTSQVKGIEYQSVTAGGTVTSEGNSDVKARGVCYGTTEDLTIESSLHTTDSVGKGEFTSYLANLDPGGNYFVRAYATNEFGTGYGKTLAFQTKAYSLPQIHTLSITLPTHNSARCGGTIVSTGGLDISTSGIC